MKRVFLIDVLRCPCGGSRRLLSVITTPDVILAILRCLGLTACVPARGPPVPASPSTDPQPDPHEHQVRLVLD
jgi:hypothetical protein